MSYDHLSVARQCGSTLRGEAKNAHPQVNRWTCEQRPSEVCAELSLHRSNGEPLDDVSLGNQNQLSKSLVVLTSALASSSVVTISVWPFAAAI